MQLVEVLCLLDVPHAANATKLVLVQLLEQRLDTQAPPFTSQSREFEFEPSLPYPGPPISLVADADPEFDVWTKLWSNNLMDHIVAQTEANLGEKISQILDDSCDSFPPYASGRDPMPPITKAEIYVYIGIRLYMGIVKLPSLDMYWSRNSMYATICPSVMPYSR